MEIKYVFGKLIQMLQIPQIHNSKIDGTSKIRFRCLIVGCNIEKFSYVAENTSILYCDIGSYTSIASDCFIGGASHPKSWVSTSPVFQSCSSVIKKKIMKIPYNPYQKTIIGNDVWIGSHSLIRAGVKIGTGAIVGMGSVVVKNIPPYEIWAGNPARKIGERFDSSTKEKLLLSKWWEKDIAELKKYEAYFTDPNVFVEEMI